MRELTNSGLRFKERVRQVIFRYAPLEWFGKSTLGTCIWGGVKTDVVLVDLDPSDKQQMCRCGTDDLGRFRLKARGLLLS